MGFTKEAQLYEKAFFSTLVTPKTALKGTLY